jgi:hypothetical protein
VKHKGFRSGSEARINGVDKFRCLTMNVKRRRGARRLVRLDPAAAEPAARDGRGQALSDRLRLNLRASWVQVKPRKTKEKSLHFLGFSRPNRDFSEGYGESK